MMKLLVEHGADIHIVNLDNDTPLILATGGSTLNPGGEDAGTEEEALAAVTYLIEELGFDVNAVNNNGETPLFGPSYRGWNRVARYLLDQGAELGVENLLGVDANPNRGRRVLRRLLQVAATHRRAAARSLRGSEG